jgi:5-formyltetrahydrofolate cyclo-ligase
MTVPDKISIRNAMLPRRQSVAPEERATWSQACAGRLCALIETLSKAPLTVAGYMATKSEVDVMPALAALSIRHIIALPVIAQESKVLAFKRFTPGDVLVKGAYGIEAPAPGAKEITPDIIIVPLIAFDRAGHRVGHGGGYYDATLGSFGHAHPVLAIGVAFALQEVDIIPAETFDARLNIVVTEKEIIRIA